MWPNRARHGEIPALPPAAAGASNEEPVSSVTPDSVQITLGDVQAAGAAIRKAIADGDGPLPPKFLVEFLLQEWRRYLALTHHRHGPESDEWAAAVDCTRRLILSVLPVRSASQRSKLMQSLPRLVTDLKAGCAVAATPGSVRDAFLAQLREIHLALIEPPKNGKQAPEPDLSDTITMDVRDPRYRMLLDKLDGADGVEHIEM